ncbi:MAG: metal ABC transporter permease [Armatimonadetes bacterium]|nr:metal ABC transporter permease [Armatimonadota bacterium]
MTLLDVLDSLRLNATGLMAGMAAAAACSFLGVYVVLRRIVFVGAALAQVAGAGIALAFLLGPILAGVAHRLMHVGGPLPHVGIALQHMVGDPLAVSLVVTVLGAALLDRPATGAAAARDARIGMTYLVASALSLVFIVKSPKGLDDVRELLDGNIIAVSNADLVQMVVVFALVALVHAVFFRQVLFVSFDPEMAATQGFDVRRWEQVFFATLAVVISVAISKAGLVAVFAYLVFPAATALKLVRRMGVTFAVSVSIGIVATIAGYVVAVLADLPTSPPTIGALCTLWFAASVYRWRRPLE